MARDVSVRLDADVASYVAKMKAASASTGDLAKRIGVTSKQAAAGLRGVAREAEQSAAAQAKASAHAAAAAQKAANEQKAAHERSKASMASVGSFATKAGLAGAAGLGLMAKAAIDWESDWAGVTKTVSGTKPELDALQGSLREMAKTMPATHHDIAAVAEAAGQLGVRTKDIAGFTKVMIELGDTTNLSSDEAATSLAQFMNVMNTAPDKVSNLGSALVYLGNNGASTEKQILELGQRAAAAGGQIGLSEADVLSFASAITSTGQNVEAGGTAISKVFSKINTAVQSGGANLDAMAKVSGSTSEQFAKDFKERPAEAIDSFVEGLGQIKANGGDVRQTLKDMGISGAYEVDTLGRLAGASKAAGRQTGLLTENLINGKKGFEQNTALAKEAATRYETTASKISISWNKIKDSAITAGGQMLPVVSEIAGTIGKLATAAGKVPAPIASMATKLALVTTASLLVGGGMIKAVTGLASFRAGLTALSTDSPRAAANLGKFGKAAGAATIAVVALVAASEIDKAINGTFIPSLEQANKALLDLGQTGKTTNLDELFTIKGTAGSLRTAKVEVSGLDDAFAQLARNSFSDRVNEKVDAIRGSTDGATTKIKLQLKELDAGIGALTASGHTEEAAQAFATIAAKAAKAGYSTEELTAQFPTYVAAVTAAAAANGNTITTADQLVTLMSGGLPAGFKAAADSADGAAGGTKTVGTAADQAKVAIDKLVTSMGELANAQLEAAGGADGVQSAINSAKRGADDYVAAMVAKAEADGKSTKSAKANAEAAIANGKAFHGTSDESIALRTSLRGIATASLANLNGMTKNGESAEAVSKANEKARDSFVQIARSMGATKGEAKKLADEYFGIGEIDVKPKVTAKSNAKQVADLSSKYLKSVKDGKAKVTTTSDAKKKASDATTFLKNIKNGKPKVVTSKDMKAAEAAVRYLKGIRDKKPKVVTAKDLAAARAVVAYLRGIKDKEVTVTTKAIRRETVITNKTNDNGPQRPHTGGMVTYAGLLYRSAGGPVWGAGTATSDSIDAKLSNGEYVQKAKAVEYYGAAAMQAVNNMRVPRENLAGYAGGGLVGGVPGNVDIGFIYKLIAAIANPLKDLSKLTTAVRDASRAYNSSVKALANPAAAKKKADKAYEDAKDERDRKKGGNTKQAERARDNVDKKRAAYEAASSKDRNKVAKAEKELREVRADAAKTKGNTAADKRNIARAQAKLEGARSRDSNKDEKRALDRARAAYTKLTRGNTKENSKESADVAKALKAKTAAQDAYTKAQDRSKAASEKLKDAQAALAAEQQQVADTARSASENLQGQFESASTDARDWVQSLTQGAADVKAFGVKIKSLRAGGLNESLIQQIAGLGVAPGTEVATQIAAGGQGLIGALNDAAKNLKTQSDLLGLLLATPGSFAGGGRIGGTGTGTSDSNLIRASRGEWIVPEKAVQPNLAALQAMTYGGRSVVSRNFAQGFAAGGPVQGGGSPLIDTAALAMAVRQGMAGLQMTATVNGDTVQMVVDQALGGFVSGFKRGAA